MIKRFVLEVTAADDLAGAVEVAVAAVQAALKGRAGLGVTACGTHETEPWTVQHGAPLSRAEKRIAWYIAQGMKRSEVAEQIKINVKTFDSHRLRVLAKLCCTNEVQLARLAIREGWIAL